MKKTKFFIQTNIQTDGDFVPLERRMNAYLASLPPQRDGFPDMDIAESNNNSGYNDLVVMVTSYDAV